MSDTLDCPEAIRDEILARLEQFQAPLRRLAGRLGVPQDFGDDLSQHGILAALEFIAAPFDPDQPMPLEEWASIAYTVARRAVLKAWEREAVRQSRLAPLDEREWACETQQALDDHIDLQEAFASLRGREREVAFGRREGKTLRQIGEELGISTASAGLAAEHGFAQLRQFLGGRMPE